jgi:ubiquitin-conjugating enzyme E2 J2
MASSLCVTRLRKELRELQKNPVQNIRALPKETNILEWHYVIEGTKGSPYEGGWYHGVVTFPKEYPYKPPSIQMITPNGRFKTSTPLCLSMSDFHPESWNPLWSVGTILMGLHSFMLESAPTQGSIVTTDSQKRKFAYESLEFNCKNKIFQELFPELIEVNKAEQEKRALLGPDHAFEASSGASKSMSNTSEGNGRHLADHNNASWASILGLLAAIICCTWAILSFAI